MANQNELDAELSLRERSFRMDGTALEAVFYVLLRDGHVSPGALEKIVQEVVSNDVGTTYEFTNGFIALYVKDVLTRISAKND